MRIEVEALDAAASGYEVAQSVAQVMSQGRLEQALARLGCGQLDLVAALLTLFAVRFSARPPDSSHPYGHGKIENLSAFFEAGLLLRAIGEAADKAG